MTRSAKIFVICAVIVLGIVSYIAYAIAYTVRHIPEAYAAWDTGTLLVRYMESHDDQWPKSWDDLLTGAINVAGDQPPFRGKNGSEDMGYGHGLRQTVLIDWSFDPTREGQNSPVTRLDGSAFPVVWESAEPNEMIREYLEMKPNVISTQVHPTGSAQTPNPIE